MGGEAIMSTIGYIAKGRGTDRQMSDIWHIVFESLTVFVLVYYVLKQQCSIVGRCIRRYQYRLSNRLGCSGMKKSLVYFVIPS